MGRTASGVKAISLSDDDIAVCMDIAVDDEDLLVVSENGFGKRTPISEYKVQNRGGKGLLTYKINDKTGKLIGATMCKAEDELMLINNSGVAIRINIEDVSVTGRATMGVKLMRTLEEEQVVTITKITSDENDEKEELVQTELVVDEKSEVNSEETNDNSLDKLLDRASEDDE